MYSDSLHPNLARVAAAYDAITEKFMHGLIDAADAKKAISELAARDDNGLVWVIDPDLGEWMYRTIDGRMVHATPPSSGYATPSAYDVTRNPQGPRIDKMVSYSRVQEEIAPPGSFVGETRPGAGQQGHIADRYRAPARPVAAIACAVVAAVLMVIALF